jgi:hypothetical protein
MTAADPQFMYIMLILPSLFGLTLVGEGVYKVTHEENSGLLSLVFGFMFIGMVVFAYFFFSSYVGHKV